MVLPLLVEPEIGEDAHIPGFTRYGCFLNGYLGTSRFKNHRSARFTDQASPPSRISPIEEDISTRSTNKEAYRCRHQVSAPLSKSTAKGDDSDATSPPSVGKPKIHGADLSSAPFVRQVSGETAASDTTTACSSTFAVAPPATLRNVRAPTDLRRRSIGSIRPIDPGHVTGNEHTDKRLPLSARRHSNLTLLIPGEQESYTNSAPATCRNPLPSVSRRHSMVVSMPGEPKSNAEPAPTSSPDVLLSGRRRHSVGTISGRESDESVALALFLNSSALHRRGSVTAQVKCIPENANLRRRKSCAGISETSLSPKGLRLEHDERVKRQACKDLRIIVLGSVGNEDCRPSERDLIYEEKCGSSAEVRSLFELWSDLDPEASWESTMDLVLASLKMQCAEGHRWRAERCVRDLMDVVQRRNAASDAEQSSPSGSYGSQQCTPEDLMRLLWLAADEKDIRVMNQRMQLRYLAKMRVPAPPLLSADQLHEIAEEFRHLDRKGLGHIQYDDLLTAGFVDEYTLKGIQGRYDDGSGILELSQFLDMRCPCGFRASAETERAQQQDGEFVSFVTTAELPTGHFSGWMLDKTVKRLPMGLKSLLNAKAFSVFASCTTRGLLQTSFAAWRAMSIKDDALEGYSSDTSSSASSSSLDDES